MSKQKLNFAFIGCGGNARGHGRSVSGVEDIEIVALADPSASSLDAFKENVDLDASIPTYTDHVEMLATAKPDAVVISSPHGLHFQHIMDALDAGCHVHTEKTDGLHGGSRQTGDNKSGRDRLAPDDRLPTTSESYLSILPQRGPEW